MSPVSPSSTNLRPHLPPIYPIASHTLRPTPPGLSPSAINLHYRLPPHIHLTELCRLLLNYRRHGLRLRHPHPLRCPACWPCNRPRSRRVHDRNCSLNRRTNSLWRGNIDFGVSSAERIDDALLKLGFWNGKEPCLDWSTVAAAVYRFDLHLFYAAAARMLKLGGSIIMWRSGRLFADKHSILRREKAGSGRLGRC
jgi:hypothetical protein